MASVFNPKIGSGTKGAVNNMRTIMLLITAAAAFSVATIAMAGIVIVMDFMLGKLYANFSQFNANLIWYGTGTIIVYFLFFHKQGKKTDKRNDEIDYL